MKLVTVIVVFLVFERTSTGGNLQSMLVLPPLMLAAARWSRIHVGTRNGPTDGKLSEATFGRQDVHSTCRRGLYTPPSECTRPPRQLGHFCQEDIASRAAQLTVEREMMTSGQVVRPPQQSASSSGPVVRPPQQSATSSSGPLVRPPPPHGEPPKKNRRGGKKQGD